MLDKTFLDTMDKVVSAIRSAGYDPYSQLNVFLLTDDDRYITRSGNARQMIHTLDHRMLKRYVRQMKYRQSG